MSQSSRIRTKMAHRQLFAFTPYAYSTIEYLMVEQNEDFGPFMALQVEKPQMSKNQKIQFQDLVNIVNQVAEDFGCDQDDCPECLLNHQIDGDLAYGIIKSAAGRAVLNCDTREKLTSLSEPLTMLVEKLEQFGKIQPKQQDFLPGMISSYKTSAAMTFRTHLDDLQQFDWGKAEQQALSSCKRALSNQDFDKLPPYFSKPLYDRLAQILGSRHGKTQAEAKLPDNASPAP